MDALLPTGLGRRIICRLEMSLNKIILPEAVFVRVQSAIYKSSKLVYPSRKSKIATGKVDTQRFGGNSWISSPNIPCRTTTTVVLEVIQANAFEDRERRSFFEKIKEISCY